MMLQTHIASAIGALRANPLRSLLTMGGLAVGVAALISLAGIGEGFSSAVSEEMAALGTRLIVIVPRAPAQDRRADRTLPATLVAADSSVLAVIPGIAHAVPMLLGEQVALGSAGNGNLAVLGVEPGFATALHLRVQAGRLLESSDEADAAKTIVLGARAARILLGPDATAIIAGRGAEITVGRAVLQVAGVLEPVGSLGGWNIDESGFVPFSTARMRLLGADALTPNKIDALLINLAEPAAKAAISADVSRALREQHRIAPGDSNDFSLVDLAASARAETAILSTIRMFLAIMAAATTLVGGVGIMNIMLVAVAERTGEIGLRQALGARRSDILTQFLIEAMMLALIGGVAGAALGVAAGSLAGSFAGLRFELVPGFVVAATVGAALVGVASGLLPARRAARLSPLAALRREG
jgi:putative ABC transport system permease protein